MKAYYKTCIFEDPKDTKDPKDPEDPKNKNPAIAAIDRLEFSVVLNVVWRDVKKLGEDVGDLFPKLSQSSDDLMRVLLYFADIHYIYQEVGEFLFKVITEKKSCNNSKALLKQPFFRDHYRYIKMVLRKIGVILRRGFIVVRRKYERVKRFYSKIDNKLDTITFSRLSLYYFEIRLYTKTISMKIRDICELCM